MTESTANPLLQPWRTPFGLPPFDQVRPEHYGPALLLAMQTHRAEADAIAENDEQPTFENAIAAFDRRGRDLGRIVRLFFNLAASETSPALQAVEREISPRLAAHYSAIRLHAGLFLSDNYARPNKRGGAWMNAYRWQSRVDGETLPIIVNNNNFAKGPPGEPTLLSADDVRTLFHEFAHGLHGLLSQVTYERLSGTQVLRLPSACAATCTRRAEHCRRRRPTARSAVAIP